MKVLITGGQGFLGKHVINEFCRHVEHPIEDITSLDNLDPLCGGQPGIHIHTDVRNLYSLSEVIARDKYTHIIHLAAYGRNLTCQKFHRAAWDVNVEGTRNVLEAACFQKCKPRVIVCSSNITLSDKNTVYKSTKVAVEALVEQYDSLGLSVMGLRPSNIYGAGQSKREYQLCAFAGLDLAYKHSGRFSITGDGTQTRDWVHAKDVARAFVAAAYSKISGTTFDVCTGHQTSVNKIASMLGVPVEYTDARPGDAKTLVSDRIPAYSYLGFTAKIKLEDGIWDAFPSVGRPQ